MNNSSKVIALIGGLHIQDHEFFYPKYRLSEESGIIVKVATPDNKETLSNKGSKILPDLAIEDLNAKDFTGVVMPGGAHAMEYLRRNTALVSFMKEMNNLEKIIASICQGGQIMISANIIRNRKFSAYYSIKDDVINAGGIYTDEPSVIDKNIVSTAHYKDMGPWMKDFIKLISTQ
jgi:protease I